VVLPKITLAFKSYGKLSEHMEFAQAGPPYELNPHSLSTVGSGPALLGGLLIDGKAPSSTSSNFLDKVMPLRSA
jgi:hypothetical protein